MHSLFHFAVHALRRAAPPTLPGPRVPPTSSPVQRADAFADSVEQLRRQRVRALRDWLGEDHELVLATACGDGSPR